MDENGRAEDAPCLQPGEIWLIEQPVATGLCALDGSALLGADAVLYDPMLAAFLADRMHRGRYAEPLTPGLDSDRPAISTRALKLACEGWSVVQLVQARCGWRRRLRDAADRSAPPGSSGNPAVRLIAKTGADRYRSREACLAELSQLVDQSGEDEPLTLILGPLGAPASSADLGLANGLAG